MAEMVSTKPNRTVGWREWVSLPDLGIPKVKAKIDSGALTSSLHAFELETGAGDDAEMVQFKIHPVRKRDDIVLTCTAPIVDRRVVRDSGGHQEQRIVVESSLQFGPFDLFTQFTLTSRDDMLFRMLLGRRALKAGGMLVDVSQSYIHGRFRARNYVQLLEGVT
jgi:hypothetical protein